jgi:hypothetical protein
MIRTLCCLTFCIYILFSLFPQQAFADQKIHKHTNTTFFSFFEDYLIAYNALENYNKHVLAAETQAVPTQTPELPLPTVIQSDPPLSGVPAYILNGVNEYRASLGLSQVQSSAQTCAFAAVRAQEISNGFNHNGFYDRVNNHTIPYDKWAHATENIAQAPDYKEVVTLWKNSPEHAANMRDNTPYVCIEQYGSYYAYEGMRP